MFPFSRDSKDSKQQPESASAAPPAAAAAAHPLDALTGGVFSATTSGERAQRVREWLATQPAQEQMQAVYKDLSAKDKGAAKALREKLDEIRRTTQQDAVAQEWADKASALLAQARLNIADALAWQRDAARAGAPLSRQPLAGLRQQLTERVKSVEDLQQRVMVQREAAVLMAQRIELLSTKPWADALAAQAVLQADVAHWRAEADALQADAQWPSVEVRYLSQLETAQSQLAAVWSAFGAALAQTQAAALDAATPLPSVPVWADEIRAARGEAAPAAVAATAAPPEKAARAKPDPAQIAAATQAVETGVMLLEQAVSSGHTKNMHSAAGALRQALKTHGRLIGDALEARVHAALISAGEMEGWQRWSADKVRQDLLAQAEALLVKRKKKPAKNNAARQQNAPAEKPAQETAAAAQPPEAAAQQAAEQAAPPTAPQPPETVPECAPEESANSTCGAPAPADAAEEAAPPAETTAALDTAAPQANPLPALADDEEWAPAMGGRKLQEAIRKLREQWKTTDQSGAPNHQLWKRFDRACNAAHHFVDQWLDKVRGEAAEHKAQREALIEEVNAFAAAQTAHAADWKLVNRKIHQFSERWRNAGHVSEKLFAELQQRWKTAIHAAAIHLEAAQKASTLRRQALIAEAEQLGAAAQLRIDAIKDLQRRWQAEAQSVPMDRKHEQKLWDAFRTPIDAAFNRKSAEREKAQTALSAHDQAVLAAARALQAASATGDAQQIRAAMGALENAMRGGAGGNGGAQQSSSGSTAKPGVKAETEAAEKTAAPNSATSANASADPASADSADAQPVQSAAAVDDENNASATPPASPAPAAATKPVVAVRGDDRPGLKKKTAPAENAPRKGGFGERRALGAGARERRERDATTDRRPDRGPRLGDAAFRAQRDAIEHAQAALKKLAAQAHGETLSQLVSAWAARQPDQLPSAQELGRAISGGVRQNWAHALQNAPQGDAAEPLLRLEMAADTPTPAEHLQARRALQLQLLTRRNAPAPAQTWADDAARVLASAHSDATARRLQNALKVLLRQ
ncbi:MAG: DUF349 domain-containing protein [Burkholderiaceae bacterium]|jgi:hypothetical protein|nr:DUF349 domain-containing protein [Burkholderiaceae bacterium]